MPHIARLLEVPIIRLRQTGRLIIAMYVRMRPTTVGHNAPMQTAIIRTLVAQDLLPGILRPAQAARLTDCLVLPMRMRQAAAPTLRMRLAGSIGISIRVPTMERLEAK